MTPCPHVNVVAAGLPRELTYLMVVLGAGAGPESIGVPTAVPAGSAFMSLASRTAPSTFTSPAPCSIWLEPASCCEVYIKIIFTMFGVKLGLTWRSRAAAPATTGVAIEVPLRRIIFWLANFDVPASSVGLARTRRLASASAETILLPG